MFLTHLLFNFYTILSSYNSKLNHCATLMIFVYICKLWTLSNLKIRLWKEIQLNNWVRNSVWLENKNKIKESTVNQFFLFFFLLNMHIVQGVTRNKRRFEGRLRSLKQFAASMFFNLQFYMIFKVKQFPYMALPIYL